MKNITTVLEVFSNSTTQVQIPATDLCQGDVKMRFNICGKVIETQLQGGSGNVTLGKVPLKMDRVEYQLLNADGSVVAWGMLSIRQHETVDEEGGGSTPTPIPDGSIGTQQLADGAVTFPKLGETVQGTLTALTSRPPAMVFKGNIELGFDTIATRDQYTLDNAITGEGFTGDGIWCYVDETRELFVFDEMAQMWIHDPTGIVDMLGDTYNIMRFHGVFMGELHHGTTGTITFAVEGGIEGGFMLTVARLADMPKIERQFATTAPVMVTHTYGMSKITVQQMVSVIQPPTLPTMSASAQVMLFARCQGSSIRRIIIERTGETLFAMSNMMAFRDWLVSGGLTWYFVPTRDILTKLTNDISGSLQSSVTLSQLCTDDRRILNVSVSEVQMTALFGGDIVSRATIVIELLNLTEIVGSDTYMMCNGSAVVQAPTMAANDVSLRFE